MGKPSDISSYIGNKINRLTILEDLGMINGVRMAKAHCECGKIKSYNFGNVKSGKSKSCGCLPIEKNTRHGLHKTKLYEVWEGMIDRCCNENHKHYHRYGGRGVSVCDEWRHSPKAFCDWAKDKWAQGLKLDKDKLSPYKCGILYSPEFCCFITHKENSMYRNNSRVIEYNGLSLCVSQWAEKVGIGEGAIRSRLRYGWPIEKVLTQEVDKSCRKNAYK